MARCHLLLLAPVLAAASCGVDMPSDAPPDGDGGVTTPPIGDGATSDDGATADADVRADAADSATTYPALCPRRPNAAAPAPFTAPPPDVNGARIRARYV